MRARPLVLLVLLAMTVPTSAATWYVAGTFEPDTSYDTPEWMFQDPPPRGVSRIYMNGVVMTKAPVGVSPNVGALQTQNEPPAAEWYFVFLGVWNDCNGDGYIGAAEHALREYPATLLSSTTGCPAATGPNNQWAAGAHNYNGWVTEFLWIGRQGTQRIFPDSEMKVWGDYERPDHDPVLGWCPTTPLPRGTLQSTGGLLNYARCRLEQKEIEDLGTFNAVVDATGDPLGLRFEDEHNAASGPVGQVGTLGSEDQQYNPVFVWDCDSTPTQAGPARVWRVDPRVGNPDPNEWSIAAFYNATQDGIHPLDDCDHTNDHAGGVYLNEDDFNPVNPNNKTESDWNFNFVTGPGRGGPPLGTVLGPGTAGAPADGGVFWSFTQHAGWNSDNSYSGKTGPRTIRASIENGVEISSAYWITYYADVTQQTLDRGYARPQNAPGTYGSWQCGANTSGIHHGWNCDRGMWYRNPDGSPYVQLTPRAYPGDPYDLRDVDCYDGSNSLGVALGVPAYGDDPCT